MPNKEFVILTGSATIALLILMIDLSLPLGVAGGVPYVAVLRWSSLYPFPIRRFTELSLCYVGPCPGFNMLFVSTFLLAKPVRGFFSDSEDLELVRRIVTIQLVLTR